MLSKIIGITAIIGFLVFSPNADAHDRKHKQKPLVCTPTVVVTIGWDWMDATLFRKGHWYHPHYGKSHRVFKDGPPPARPHAHATWVPGHHKGRGHNRHWIPGHWKQ